ncbi:MULTISPECIES: hypothetical protein [Agrobacterium]|jgi:hypothetical protein|nr:MULTISPECIES: hypothetical protein [Agrobacterium]EGL65104.1 hypothetical protein AGRO_2224 [Agrobacterium sp. ATCC 31749]MCR6726845.1 hypothetical protein [Agrobacterium fabrum]QKW98793.1 hypothetical protein GSF67_16495 [Agrobacterium sp. CGMCC 11546]WCK78140.1 hypothetical protein G6L39_015720 [Agrobacterium fabrum]
MKLEQMLNAWPLLFLADLDLVIMLDATGVPAEVTLGESLGKMETG